MTDRAWYVVVAFRVEGHPDWQRDPVRRAIRRIVTREAKHAIARLSGLDVAVREVSPPRTGKLTSGQWGDYGI